MMLLRRMLLRMMLLRMMLLRSSGPESVRISAAD